jgi:hypothetical protein
VKEFDAATGVEAPQKQDLDEDEDLMMVGDVVKNDKCPYTKKDVSVAWCCRYWVGCGGQPWGAGGGD